MNADYRLVYFSRRPQLAERVPVAAVLRTNEGVSAVASDHLPSWGGQAGKDVGFMLQLALADLAEAPLFDQLPSGMGPHFHLGSDVRQVPRLAADPASWVKRMLADGSMTGRKQRSPNLLTESRNFLEELQISQLVKERFSPDSEASLAAYRGALQPITQFVRGHELLLLEPVRPKLDAQIQKVNTRFLAYKRAFQESDAESAVRLVGYVLPGEGTARDEVLDGLSACADIVFDGASERGRTQFADLVKAAA